MVAELRSELRTFVPLHAMSAAGAADASAPQSGYGAWGTPSSTPPGSPRVHARAAGGAHFAAAGPILEAAALRAWKVEVEGRLDAADTAITGVTMNLGATIEHAKVALNGIVQGVRVELLGSQAQDRALLEQLNVVVAATAAKFTEIEGVVDKVAHDVVRQVAAMDLRTAELPLPS